MPPSEAAVSDWVLPKLLITTANDASHRVPSTIFSLKGCRVMSILNDQSLIARVVAKDPHAFDELFPTAAKELAAHISVNHGIPYQEAEEVAADTLIAAHGSLDNYDSNKGTFKSWIFGIERHKALNHKKAAQKSTEVPLRDMERIEDQRDSESATRPGYGSLGPSDEGSEGAGAVESKEMQILREVLDSLSEKKRDILLAREVDEYENIARDEGVEPGTLRKRRFDAMKEVHNKVQKRLEGRKKV
jgi:RNA polymerase sigma factor (sigma-70 family)